MIKLKTLVTLIFIVIAVFNSYAAEYHVSKEGRDTNTGFKDSPFNTISNAVEHAISGDTITVHEGIYREWVNPIRGGKSESERILYRAAPNEKVEIRGSEIISGWKKVKKGIWKVEIQNSFFGDYNPFNVLVHGDWFNDQGRIHHTGDIFINGQSLYEVEALEKVYNPVIEAHKMNMDGQIYTWYCENNDLTTTIWANFHEYNPNSELTEISVRKTCFYPEVEGVNYITIRGFEFSQAATQWAAPTAEQVGMISTHWNKAWIIEDNLIHDSKCNGITLGKERGTGHNVWSADVDNLNRDGNIHYIEVLFRVLRNNWDKEHVGSHLVRNNTIYNCEQTGICGSMGAVFSTIENNHIYNINIKEQFKGWELGGIKLHAPIDVTIKNNRIHDCERGIWLDWMTQGARVTANVLYRNREQDLFMEVNHGPFIVDNNIFLSKEALRNWSQGGAYIHNLFMGRVSLKDEERFTPYFLPHSTDVAALSAISGGDDKFYHNIIGEGRDETNKTNSLSWMLEYDSTKYGNTFSANIYVNGVVPPEIESYKENTNDKQLIYNLIEDDDELQIIFDNLNYRINKEPLTSSVLGKTKVSKCAFDDVNGNDIIFNVDYMGDEYSIDEIYAGPFSTPIDNSEKLTIWKRP